MTSHKEYPWLLTLSLNNMEGIARFVRGLPTECMVDKDSDFASYLMIKE